MSHYFDRQGKSINIDTWGDLTYDPKYKFIKKTELPDGKIVSTVWLGINHNYDEGAPLIFETMVFKSKKDFEAVDDFCERYSTEEEALKGHEEACKKYS